MKRLFLELGGKSAAIVLDDADLAAASMLGFGVCMHAGQGCATPTRMLLPRSRYDEGVELLKGIFESVDRRRPPAPDTLCGPVISAKQRDRVVGYIQKGIAEGANLLVGGPQAPAGLDKGFFVTPTLFVDVDNAMTDRPRGDLRTGARRHPLRGRRRGGPDRQRQPLRPRRLRAVRLARPLARRRPPPAGRDDRHERRRRLRRRRALRRLQGQRRRTPERHGRLRPVPRGEVGRLAAG